ncbi:MAG: pseudouridine-5'-phosphate glycosidase [Candidatus Pelethousia sp.]|nr:pseudouridine-5'-phosphate glycosidase [Candidatus Pelethousia sp.]
MEVNRFLVESALLTHGLASISCQELADSWPREYENIVWVDKGNIHIAGMCEFLSFRERADQLCRIDRDHLSTALKEGVSGALTASGTMAVCRLMGLPLAVTCGIGGISDIRAERICPDLPALRDLPVTLLATSFKDMMDIPASIGWLRENGVRVLGVGVDCCTGYLFNSANAPLAGVLEPMCLPAPSGNLLLLNPTPAKERLPDLWMLDEGIAAGKQAEAAGKYYHPAANAAFDRLTGGISSQMQLHSIIANAKLGDKLVASQG